MKDWQTEFRKKLILSRGNKTQAEIASEISVSKQAISKWENGENTPTVENFVNYCKAVGKPISFFFPPSEDEKDELSLKEQALIEGFRTMPEPVQAVVATIVDNYSAKICATNK